MTGYIAWFDQLTMHDARCRLGWREECLAGRNDQSPFGGRCERTGRFCNYDKGLLGVSGCQWCGRSLCRGALVQMNSMFTGAD